jgi:hypothetical protein
MTNIFIQLPIELKRIIMFEFFPRHSTAQLFHNNEVLSLKYTRHFMFDEKYKLSIWEFLRPTNMCKSYYGDGGDFSIIRKKLSMREVIQLLQLLQK